MGLADPVDQPIFTPLAGGISSLIVKVRVGGQAFCLKRALPKLKVASDWYAPVGRNAAEIAWMRVAAGCVPDAVPHVLGEDAGSHGFAMEFLDPDRFSVWKSRLLAGDIEPDTARQVAWIMAAVHRHTAGRKEIREGFANDAQFSALRLEPYLEASARAHPDLADAFEAIRRRTAETRRVLVHGDISPKNILVGDGRVILLDAECAWYGDPAFDLAFCLNHMILKSARDPAARARFGACYGAIAATYFDHVDWEDRAGLDRRTASLLAALLLARIDGKSPVEYLPDPVRGFVRQFARRCLVDPPGDLASLWRLWEGAA